MHRQWATEEEESSRLVDLILHGRDEDLVKHLTQLPVSTRKSASTHLTKDGNSALHFAALRERLGGLAVMLDARVDLGIRNGSGESPLFLCMSHNALKSARLLVDNGADVNEITGRKDNESLLHKMVKGDRVAAVETLLNANVSINCTTRNGDTPLHFAARFNRPIIARFLLQARADINLVNDKKETALHMAIANRSGDLAKILIKAGAKVNIPDRQGMTALHLAVASGALDLVRLMLNNNSTHVNSKEKLMGRTPLLLACSGTNQKLAPLLLSHGADANLTTNYRKTVLHLAASAGNTHALNAVIKHASNLNALATNNKTPLHCAVNAGQLEAVRILLRAGVNPNLKDIEGDTALHMAAAAGDARIAGQLLLQPDLHVNATNMRQRTALHAALMAGHEETGNMLVAAGCDPEMLDVFEKNAFNYLEEYQENERQPQEEEWPAEHEASRVHFSPNDDKFQGSAMSNELDEENNALLEEVAVSQPEEAESVINNEDNLDSCKADWLPFENGESLEQDNNTIALCDLEYTTGDNSPVQEERVEGGDHNSPDTHAREIVASETSRNKKNSGKSKHRHRKSSKSSGKARASSPQQSKAGEGRGGRSSHGSTSGEGGGVLGMVRANHHHHEHHEHSPQRKSSHQHDSNRRRKLGFSTTITADTMQYDRRQGRIDNFRREGSMGVQGGSTSPLGRGQ
ncbi:ankyrin-3 [Plakobranchus ocellatus]|uniref:Ankyrin-3 n=1 Tax=Plakobranchus ocellatus TaxID=259542 RepID=A0AAV4BJB6_9GAST|nr:ankyrin-3 [Plakobranchus ocellatus]